MAGARTRHESEPLPRLLLIGAGRTEIGSAADGPPSEKDLSGAALPLLVDRLLERFEGGLFPSGDRQYEIAGTARFDQIFLMGERGAADGPRRGDERKIGFAMLQADLRGCHGLVILIDRESLNQPDRASRLKDGRCSYRQKAGDAKAMPCAIGACCRCVETWLLADREALRHVFGPDADDPFTGDPEERPSADKLKSLIAGWAQEAGIEDYQAREDLARHARPEELRRRCRTSYPPFADDVVAEIGPVIRQRPRLSTE